MTDLSLPLVPRWLRIWAIVTVCAAVPLALLGAETTTRGVGMADQTSLREPWYFFTLDLRHTPFGLLIEHGHRLFGWIMGGCSLVLAIGLTFGARGWQRWIGWPVGLLVAAQAVFGILRVKYNALAGPELAAFHGCFAQLTFAAVVTVAVLVSKTWSVPVDSPRSMRWLGLATCAVLFVQIAFGAITRHLLDSMAQRLHILLAFAALGFIFALHGRLHREGKNVAARWTGYLLALFVLVQPILGVEAWLRRFGSGTLPELVPFDPTLDLIRSAHHLLGTMIFSTTAALTAFLYRPSSSAVPTTLPEPAPTNTVSSMPFATMPARQLEGSV